MASQFKRENKDLLLAFLTLTAIILVVAVVGFYMLRKGPEIVQGEVDVDEFRVSSKVPARVYLFFEKKGENVYMGENVCINGSPGV